jgi:hypothetical protein
MGWIEMFELNACIYGCETPLNGCFLKIANLFPGCDFSPQLFDVSYASPEALVNQDRELDFNQCSGQLPCSGV